MANFEGARARREAGALFCGKSDADEGASENDGKGTTDLGLFTILLAIRLHHPVAAVQGRELLLAVVRLGHRMSAVRA